MLAARHLDGIVLFHPIRMAYVSGFFHLTTERPMAIVVPLDGGLGALIPQLEQEHIAKSPSVTQIKVYPEYPSGGTKHPSPISAISSPRWGWRANGWGTTTTATTTSTATTARCFPRSSMGRRSTPATSSIRCASSRARPNSAFIFESAQWGNLAHRLMQEKLALGRTELDISLEASTEAARMMIATLGPTYRPLTMVWGSPV